MFDMVKHRGNENQNYTEIPFHPRMATMKKTKTNDGEDTGKTNTQDCGWICKLVQWL
jgi:hypothetical protein